MDKFVIQGGNRLSGKIYVSGAKNAALPLMCLPLLTDQTVTLHNVPHLADITAMAGILSGLGCETEMRSRNYSEYPHGHVLKVLKTREEPPEAPYDLIRKMRAGVLVAGPLLARYGKVRVSLPGGCAIGARPIDIHLEGFKALGAQIELENGYVNAVAPAGGLRGADIHFRFASVGATENVMMAAVLAKGETVIHNAAREPEIVNLAEALQAMGATISGAGEEVIRIQGTETLNGAEITVIPDRIEAGTFMIAAAITGGDLEIVNAIYNHNEAFIHSLQNAGVEVTPIENGVRARLSDHSGLRAIEAVTAPYPGFPTDLQAQLTALLCLAKGESKIHETVFENRFMHVPELARMGADIHLNGGEAVIKTIEHFSGAVVMATDLRASVSLVLAGLVANGVTEIKRLYHLDRGYECLEEKLRSCGAEIRRERDF